MAALPDWYDDLDGTLANAFAALSAATCDRNHGFRAFSLANIGRDQRPRSRTVVIRSVDEKAWTLAFHTDTRSDKFADLKARPAVSLSFWDPAAKLQILVNGIVSLELGASDARAIDAYSSLDPNARATYRIEPGPGTVLPAPDAFRLDAIRQDIPVEADPGLAQFCRASVSCDSVEVLYLASGGHRRSRFRRDQGAVRGEWLAP